MSIELMLALQFVAFLVFVILGLPIAFSLIGVSLVLTVIFITPTALHVVFTSLFGVMTTHIYIAGALFTFMATLLQSSGIAAALFDALYKWSGPLRGGLAVVTIMSCTIIAAMSGIGATGTLTMGLLAYPEMEKRGYNKSLSLGTIAVGGTLGPLIPPSILMIILGGLAHLSIGKLFAGGVLPGLLLSLLWIGYILIRSGLNPKLAPALPKEERPSWKEKFTSLASLILPISLIIAVLGGIYSGAATPSEAAGVGALGAILSAAVYRTLTWNNLKQALLEAFRITVMVFWLLTGGMAFSYFLSASGGGSYIVGLMVGAPLGTTGALLTMLMISLILGCFIDGASITVITVPIFFPIVYALGLDPLWFGVVFIQSLVIGFVTPPFGFNLFYTKGILPPHSRVTMKDIYVSVIPFIALELVTLALVIVFPQIILFLPSFM